MIFYPNALGTNAIQEFLNKLKNKVGFDCSPHRFRHNFATSYILNSMKSGHDGDVNKLQLIMGHSDIKTTFRYYHDALELIAISNPYSHMDCINW